MSRTSNSTKNNVTVLRASGNNIEKIRCPNCKQQAHPVPDGRGGKILRCSGCGNKFITRTM